MAARLRRIERGEAARVAAARGGGARRTGRAHAALVGAAEADGRGELVQRLRRGAGERRGGGIGG